MYSRCNVLKQMCTAKHGTKHTDTKWQRFFKNNLAVLQARWIALTALLSVPSSLGPSMAINICHWCLVRSQPFSGTGRFLAGLFTFLSRQPVVNQLRVCGRNWFRTVIITTKTKVISQVFCMFFPDLIAELWNVVSPACKWTAGNLSYIQKLT